jgi:hypothetical protein
MRHTSVFKITNRRRLSAEAVAALAIRNRDAMRRRVESGTYVSPTKDPLVAAKVSAALKERVRQGKWRRPPPPERDPATGQWLKKAKSSWGPEGQEKRVQLLRRGLPGLEQIPVPKPATIVDALDALALL